MVALLSGSKGSLIVNRSRHVCNPGWAVAALALAALALGGCGRKGPLDLPPSALAAPAVSTAPVASVAPVANDELDSGPSPIFQVSPDEPPIAATKGRKKTFILDPLLGN